MDYKAINCDIISKFAISLIVELLIAKIYCEFSMQMKKFNLNADIQNRVQHFFFLFQNERSQVKLSIYCCQHFTKFISDFYLSLERQVNLFDLQQNKRSIPRARLSIWLSTRFFLFSSPCVAYLFSICCFILISVSLTLRKQISISHSKYFIDYGMRAHLCEMYVANIIEIYQKTSSSVCFIGYLAKV